MKKIKKTNHTNKNYSINGAGFQLVLPLNYEVLIPDDESVRLLSRELEELDYRLLYKAYSTRGRKPAVDPKTMFKILVYAYSQNIYSSRKIESACKRDINFMWLLENQKAPDHSTISRFRTGALADACEDLFYQFVRRLAEIGELGQETVFIDGTKIEACANKYSFVWKGSVSKWAEKMLPKVIAVVNEINNYYSTNFKISPDNRTSDIQEVFNFLEKYCKENNVTFVQGRGCRKSKDQKFYEEMRNFLDRQIIYDQCNSKFNGRNSYSKTDEDATFMHMKDDHMRNAQLKPGYNVQIAVDSEYIVAADIFQDRNDAWTLIPMLKTIDKNLNYKYPSVTADAGYESEEAYAYLAENNQTSYIKPQIYDKWKKRSFKKDIGKRENMEYNSEEDYYICHNGKKLLPIETRKRKSKNGYESIKTVYQCESCMGCPYKDKCTKSKYDKRIYVSKKFIEMRETSTENIMSDLGIQYRTNRSIQVEGAFGVLKNDYQFKRFLLRGKVNVKLEILLLCFGYNINKLHSKTQNDRLGTYLFNQELA